jgi:hypothetical protein
LWIKKNWWISPKITWIPKKISLFFCWENDKLVGKKSLVNMVFFLVWNFTPLWIFVGKKENILFLWFVLLKNALAHQKNQRSVKSWVQNPKRSSPKRCHFTSCWKNGSNFVGLDFTICYTHDIIMFNFIVFRISIVEEQWSSSSPSKGV